MQTEWKAKTGPLSLINRSVNTLLLARHISNSIQKLEKELASQTGLDEEEIKARWTELHRKNARMTHRHILKYRGFLTKVGQAASIKAGELPKPWVEELMGLQDELPVSAFKEVRETIRKDLGRPLEQIFRDFAERPIASASVAQAHVAHLKATGRKVCVKVQHKGVASMVGTDLATIEFICERAAKYHPDAPDTTDLIREWRRASREEVDFRKEQVNAQNACDALKRAGVDVGCPEPIPELCGKRVLTMGFIEGWKITNLDRLPPGTDREALVKPLVDAFALLVFDEGLIHGDPHPGNVFAEPVDGPGGRRIRAALLDWGIVQRMSKAERTGAARWVLAVLAQDRQLFLRALKELGFVFDAEVDYDSGAVNYFVETTMGSCGWMFRDSIPSSAQLHLLEQMQKFQEKQERLETQQARFEQGQGKIISKIPGVVLFFLRGLEMLQNICGTLEVVVPFSQVVLRRAMPLLQSADASSLRALPAPPGSSELECIVRTKLEELDDAGAILGAQVAVLAARQGSSGEWLCRAVAGRTAVGGGPLSQASLLPLLDAGTGVLLLCLLAVLSRKTIAGRPITFETPVSQIWPEFAQREKGLITLGEVLQHQAGLARIYPRELSFKAFCNELRMEHVLSLAPREQRPGAAPFSRAAGTAAAALLRRASGNKSAADAVAKILEPLGLHTDITYSSTQNRMAFAGKKPQESMGIDRMYEWLEEKVEALEQIEDSGDKPHPWMTWKELEGDKPSCTDPQFVNRDCMRLGEGCVPGRGLRATAVAMCTLFATDLVPEELLHASCGSPVDLRAECKDEWRELGGCREVAVAGWQLMKFKRLENGEEVVGYGRIDGTTGSLILRLPEHSIAVLLSSVGRETRHAGPALLTAIVGHLGLEPAWPLEMPREPEKASMGVQGVPLKLPTGAILPAGGQVDRRDNSKLAKLQAKVARLKQAIEGVSLGTTVAAVKDKALTQKDEEVKDEPNDEAKEDPHAENGDAEHELPRRGVEGVWDSVETTGLEALLDAFEVPPMVQALAARASRTLKVKVEGEAVTLETTTRMMGKTVENTITSFTVGKPFEGQQDLGGLYCGMARWGPTDVTAETQQVSPGASRRVLLVEKRFQVDGREAVLEERIELGEGDKLALTTTLRAPGEQQARVVDAEEREILCGSIDPTKMRLRRELELGGEQLLRSGRIVSVGVGRPPPETLADVAKMPVPGIITVHYQDLQSTTTFAREAGSEPRWLPRVCRKQGASRVPGSRGAHSTSEGLEEPSASSAVTAALAATAPALGALKANLSAAALSAAPRAASGCAIGLLAVGWGVSSLISLAVMGLGRSLEAACQAGTASSLEVRKRMEVQRRLADALVDVGPEPAIVATLADAAIGEGKRLAAPQRPPQSQQPPPAPRQQPPQHSQQLALQKQPPPPLCPPQRPLLQQQQQAPQLQSQQPPRPLQLQRLPLQQAPPQPRPLREQQAQPEQRRRQLSASAGLKHPGSTAMPAPRKLADEEQTNEEDDTPTEARSSASSPSSEDFAFGQLFMPDPRAAAEGRKVAVIGFCSCFDPEQPWCYTSDYASLGNFHDLGPDGLKLEAPCAKGMVHSFRNAEAAFHALKFWFLAARFSGLSGHGAREKQRRLGGHADATYGGHGGAWQGMLAVLRAKFAPNSSLANELLGTGNAFLLAHDSVPGRDQVWSDGCDGKGANWLGLQLMLVRDQLSGEVGWTRYLRGLFEPVSGAPVAPAAQNQWQDAVRRAAQEVAARKAAALGG